MERTLIAPGVHLSCDPASKFNRCRISIHFAFPAERKTATAHALLPLVMERGYADCPDMTRLTKKLAKLYGADLTVDARPMGCNHNLCVSVTGIKDAFALEGEALTAEYTKIALGAAFHPYFVDGCFDPQAVSIEKQMLKKGLEDEINDKRIYCLHQANREFFGDSPAGVRQEGYLEEVDGLTPTMLTAAYRQMLRIANIELLVLGCDAAQTAAIRDALLAELACIDRAPLPLVENMAMPAIAPMHKTENYDMVQAKLCMLFTLGQPMQPQQLAAVRLAMALYGGSVTSRLFLNVRERDHLCYYCSSSFQSFTGSISFVFSKVLDESVSQIFCFCFPFGSISVCVTWVQNSWINAWQFCRNFEVEVWNGLCRSILDISVQDSIDDTTSIFDGDTFACSVPSCIYQVCFCTALLHFLNQFFCIFCRMQLQECLAEAS